MKFAEYFLINSKDGHQHNHTINSCLVRIPGGINSKCGQVVKVVQLWDGQRLAIQYLLRQFRRWLIDERIEQRRRLDSKVARVKTINSVMTIWWIEKILQTAIDNYRKFAVWYILVPYLINIRQLSGDGANNTIQRCLDKCHLYDG